MQQHFETTHWSLLLAAQQKTSPEARAALDTLCRKYWYPLYAYARRHSKSAHDALDMVQAFFAVMLEKRYLRAADRTKGRFRSFLLTALRRFMSKERDRMNAQKRGGGKPPISLDLEDAERRYALEPSHNWTPEKLYDRGWAVAILDQTMARLQEDWHRQGKSHRFDKLRAYLTGGDDGRRYGDFAAELGISTTAVKAAVHRLRKRYRAILREEVAHTLGDPLEVEDELALLLAALRGETG